MDVTIFAKRAFLNTNPSQEFISKDKSYRGHGHLQRVSSIIRADQIAERMKFKLNPTSGYEDDVCVYVKPHLKKDMDFKFEGKRAYLDIIDGHTLGELILKHPEVGVIVCSQADYRTMCKSVPNRIVCIPQHHANFDRIRVVRNKIKKIGVIGEQNAFWHLPETIDEDLAKRGIELVKYHKFFSRKDIINFYNSIDLQIVWRPYKKRLSNPLKIVNGMAFGVPSIALDEDAFKELDSFYKPVTDYEGFLKEVDFFLENNEDYQIFCNRIFLKSEDYHIDKIGEMYKKL